MLSLENVYIHALSYKDHISFQVHTNNTSFNQNYEPEIQEYSLNKTKANLHFGNSCKKITYSNKTNIKSLYPKPNFWEKNGLDKFVTKFS